MPKDQRFADTISFIRGLTSPTGMAVPYSFTVADVLATYHGAITPAVDAAMSMGRTGTTETRKYRRAMILILCVLNNTSTRNAQLAVANIPDAGLPAALAQMLADVGTIYGGRVLTPIADQLRANPLAFLTNNRIKLGRGAMTTSGPATYDFSWDLHYHFYFIEPHNPQHDYVHASVPGFNIHVQSYSAVKDGLHDIDGATATGDLVLTTQLSGCCVVYRVAGGNLTVAHIQPDAEVRRLLPQDLAVHAAQPVGVLLTHRMVRDGGMAGAGTLGMFGMVATAAETGLRLLGPRRVRTHGYTDALGNAYFVAVRIGGNWQLFAQQNNPGRPADVVAQIMQLYP